MPTSDVILPEIKLAHLGDTPNLSEPPHARRARFHQSWYRAARLGINDWGATPRGRRLGSILPPVAATAGANFTTDAARDLFIHRRKLGWGMDPVRTTSHMTSSQALLVNLLGPLGSRPGRLLDVLNGVLGRNDLRQLVRSEVEFAPPARSRYLGDMTRVDAFFVVEAAGGLEAIVLELKYTDRFSSRRLALSENSQYFDLAFRSGVWTDADEAFADGDSSQLLRCHALGIRALEVEYGALPTTLLLVAHHLDPVARATFDRYRAHLADSGSAVYATLDELLATAASGVLDDDEANAVSELRLRYLSHDLSESLWNEHLSLVTRKKMQTTR